MSLQLLRLLLSCNPFQSLSWQLGVFGINFTLTLRAERFPASSSLGLCLITLASTDMAVGQGCPLGSPFYLEMFNLKKQNKGHQHNALEIVSIYCFLSPSLAVFR